MPTAFGRWEDRVLQFSSEPGEPVRRCATPHPFVSSMRWWPQADSVLMTATPVGGQPPSFEGGKGDLALFRWRVNGDSEWELLHRGYAHDVVVLRDGEHLAAHRGAGLVFLDAQGNVVREHKVGRFDWGPPSLAAGPDANLVSWIKWRGDDRCVRVESLDGTVSTAFPTSVYRYGWQASNSIVYYKGDGPRLLDVATGHTRALFNARTATRGGDVPPEVIAFFELPKKEYALTLDHLVVTSDALWFTAMLYHWAQQMPTFSGLFRSDLDGSGWRLVESARPNQMVIDGFNVLPDGTLDIWWSRIEGGRRLRPTSSAHGPSADFMAEGWRWLADSAQPRFGFHYIPH